MKFLIIMFFLLLVDVNINIQANSFLEIEIDRMEPQNCQYLSNGHSFDVGDTKGTELKVIDIIVHEIKEIFDELFEINFPMYMASGFIEPRSITEGTEYPCIFTKQQKISIN